MRQLACIKVSSFPLQIASRENPQWRGMPIIVVANDKAYAEVLWANRSAQLKGIVPGLTHSQALSLAPQVRSKCLSDIELQKSNQELLQCIQNFSPLVEAHTSVAGIFWCDASGLISLYGSLGNWGRELQAAIQKLELKATVAVGFSRFGSYAHACLRPSGVHLLLSKSEETEQTQSLLLEKLEISSSLLSSLHALGIVSVGDFLSIPTALVSERLGAEATELHRIASHDGWEAVCPEHEYEQIQSELLFDFPEINSVRMLAALQSPIQDMVKKAASRHSLVACLHFCFQYDHRDDSQWETIRPAEASLDAKLLISLLRARLDAQPLSHPVSEVQMTVQEERASAQQLNLFSQESQRNIRAANEALARIRAELGNDSVVCAVEKEGHLPEARYEWQPVYKLKEEKRPTQGKTSRLVRRIFRPALPLSAQMLSNPDHLRIDAFHRGKSDEGDGASENALWYLGPHIVEGGWWNREIQREYYYVKNPRGAILWVYFDRVRKRWFLQGRLE